jgi:hypothetical protein
MLSEFLSPKPNKPKQLVKPISIQPGLLLIQALQYFKSKDYFRAQDCLTKYQSLQVSLPIDYKFILVEIYQFTNRIELALQTLRTLLPSKDPKFVIKCILV